ncbi:MAG TPA: YihY/virulence factor BrkB family protein [Saprospiraceae bacterium]|nr:YihY/virulence factor BrkB family protein [Saprospiraceae bacterium]HMP23148.1 YihY/virulence factor BrkB family protein [Saprospiraceae bacterium]
MNKLRKPKKRRRLRKPDLSPDALWRFVESLPVVRVLIDWSKRRSLPGLRRIPVYDICSFLYKEIQRSDLFTRANSMAFSFFISIFPSLMSLFTLLPYLRKYILKYLLPDEAEENFTEILKTEIQVFLPGNAGVEIARFIEDLITNPRVGLLSFGFFLALFFASNGMLTMMQGFEKAYTRTFKKRKPFRKRLIAIFLTFQLGILLLASVVLIIMGNFLIHTLNQWVELDKITGWAIFFTRWLAIIFLFYMVISIIYRYGMPTRRKFKLFSPGATIATVLCIVTSVGFGFYVDNFALYNKLYGSFGTIIVTMLWLQLNSLALLIGFELNASIAVNRDMREQVMEKASFE